MEGYHGEERRKYHRTLTDEELDYVIDKVLERMASNAGRKGFKAFLFILGVFVTILLTWLSTIIHVKVG